MLISGFLKLTLQTEEFIAIPEPEMTEEERETDRLIVDDGSHASAANTKKKNSKDSELCPLSPAPLSMF